MKKFFTITSYAILSILLFLYVLFLIVPPFINLDNFKPQIQKIVLDSSKLNLDYSKLNKKLEKLGHKIYKLFLQKKRQKLN